VSDRCVSLNPGVSEHLVASCMLTFIVTIYVSLLHLHDSRPSPISAVVEK